MSNASQHVTAFSERMTQVSRTSPPTVVLATAVVAALAGAVLAPVGTATAQQQPPVSPRDPVQDDRVFNAGPQLDNPLAEKREAQRQRAYQELLTGEAKPRTVDGSEVVELSDGEFVETAVTGTDHIFTVLVEFGDETHPDFGGGPGPRHNEIPEPDRAEDNTTIWEEDFDRQYYEDIYFSTDPDKPSVKQYYESQSSGRYTVEGEVTDWIQVEYNEARYGNNACGDNVCRSVWDMITDGVNAWYEQQLDAGRTPEEIRAQLAEFDVQDRYDYDDDGDFNEPDGYIDHFQMVHAGEDESAGGGAQGEDAIWAHRWYAYVDSAGVTGPEDNPAGGTEIGDTGIWVGDYTMQPENGGVGVFAHEFGHDLGLPDLYDTVGGENGTGFWTAMSSGSWLGMGDGTIGGLPNDLGPWEKLQLGWLDYDVARAGETSTHRLGPSAAQYPEDQEGSGAAGDASQALVVELPEKTVTTEINEPAQGESQWWSGKGDDLNNTLTRTVDLTGATEASLDLTGWWEIEQDYDFLYVEASTDGTAWTPLDGTADGEPIPRDGADRPALTGESGGQVALSFPLTDYVGGEVQLRFRYATDGAATMTGFTADEITVTADGEVVFSDDAESGEGDWQVEGFQVVGASITDDYPQFYVVENRQYVGFDATLEKGPYHFGWLTERPNVVEHFAYGAGMVVWLWDTSETDNNTSEHPGTGLILPVDAHPEPDRWSDDSLVRNRIQTRDAAFGTAQVPELTLHNDGEETTFPEKPGVPYFDDHTGTYWSEEIPENSVQVRDTGTRITVVDEPADPEQPITVQVGPSQS